MADPAGDGEAVVELELPPRPEVVSVARLVVGALVAADPLFDEERGADLRLAISEACTNAIQAQVEAASRVSGNGNGDGGGGGAGNDRTTVPILVRCRVAEGRIELAVTDHGGGFDPQGLEAHPEVTDPARLDHEGGLGIPLIRLLSDRVEFQVTPDGTTVVMTFEPRGADERGVLDTLGPS